MPDVIALVERAREGDSDAFAELVGRYRGLVFSICFQRTGDWHDSEDLAQEVFVTTHRSLSSIRDPAKFAAWLRGVTENVCKMQARKRAREAPLVGQGEVGSDEWVRANRSLELQSLLHRAFNAIPEASREALSLHYMGGYSYSDIADLCGLPPTTVKSRLHEARGRLKRELLRVVAELCECNRRDGETVRCVMERCGTEVCECADRLIGR